MSLIGINGQIGSGKDTVGFAIQYLTSPAFGNQDFVSFSKFVENAKEGIPFPRSVRSNWEIKKFATILKQMASMLTGIPAEKFESQEFKKSYLPKEWSKFYPGKGCDVNDVLEEKMTVREFLQKLGTEAIRNGLHDNAWVNALMSDYAQYDDIVTAPYPEWIITDTRFINEAVAIKERGGKVIRVQGHIEEGTGTTGAHISETALNKWNFDWIIENTGTLEELLPKVQEMLVAFDILEAPTLKGLLKRT